VKKYDELGMTVKIHCTGQGSTRLAFDIFEAARKANPNGPKHEIAHCNGVHDEDYKRFKQIGVTAEMSPAFYFSHPVTEASGGLMDWNFSKMRAADAHVTIGSNWGAGPDPDMLPCVARVVEKVGDGDRKYGGKRLIRMMTLAGAEAVGRAHDLGSIEVGKKGNFIAVNKDLSKGGFVDASVDTTWFEGEIVYEKRS
jgi:predicted amidohydrolase YtcJ